MHNATIYCLCLHNKILPIIKKLGYVPVGLGNDKFSKEWLRDNTLDNISHKNKYYSEYSFNYWFWKKFIIHLGFIFLFITSLPIVSTFVGKFFYSDNYKMSF